MHSDQLKRIFLCNCKKQETILNSRLLWDGGILVMEVRNRGQRVRGPDGTFDPVPLIMDNRRGKTWVTGLGALGAMIYMDVTRK